MSTAVSVILLIAGSWAALCAMYLLTLALAALRYTPSRAAVSATERVTVLVPAHNEALMIGACVRSLGAQSYPRELYEIAVIADNCDDDTAELARAAGADRVLERGAQAVRGKGPALRWAIDQLMAGAPPAAFVIVDADTTAEHEALASLVEAFASGADAAQLDYVLDAGGSPGSALRAAAFLLVNRVRPSGRSVLGLSAFLVGNGMLLSTRLLTAVPWQAFTSTEDLEYSLDVQAAGRRIAFVGGASVRSPTAPNARAAAAQQLRWEGGRAHLRRTRGPRLVLAGLRRRSPRLILAAADLLTPALGALAALGLAGAAIAITTAATGLTPAWVAVPWLVALIAIPSYVLIGLHAGRAPRSAYRALMRAPLLVLSKPMAAGRVLRFRADSWVRTERAGEGTGKLP